MSSRKQRSADADGLRLDGNFSTDTPPARAVPASAGSGRLWSPGVLYGLVQDAHAEVALPRGFAKKLARHRPPAILHAGSKTWLSLQVVVGWLWVEDLGAGRELQRWLLLHELTRPTGAPLLVTRVDDMPGGTVHSTADFVRLAREVFEARKQHAKPAQEERTRYARVASARHVHRGLASPAPGKRWMPLDWGPRPDFPQPKGNGRWDGSLDAGLKDQIDDGTVGFHDGQFKLVAVSLDSASTCHVESRSVLAAPDAPGVAATDDDSLLLSNGAGLTEAQLLALSRPCGTGQRCWLIERSSTTFYAKTFPDKP